MLLEVNKVKVFASMMDVAVGTRRNILLLLHRWQPLCPSLAALFDAAEAEDKGGEGGAADDDDDDAEALLEDGSEEEQVEMD